MHGDDQVDSDETLVQELLEDQFPEWAALPIRRLQSDGTDNALGTASGMTSSCGCL